MLLDIEERYQWLLSDNKDGRSFIILLKRSELSDFELETRVTIVL